MPTYEYACSTCGHRFDIWQQVKAPAPACEKCGAETKKIFHPSRVIFKGPGFYVTDLASEKSAGSKTKEASESSKDDSKSDSKSDSKDAAPVEAKSDKSESKSESKESTPSSTSGASSSTSEKK